MGTEQGAPVADPLGIREPNRRRLGRYELIQPLAKGGMGEVHLARTRGLGGFERLVVIKCALPTLAERTQAMLLAEARLAATLQHTNIVQVQDVGTDGHTVFFAMEYLHGQDLRAVMRRSWTPGQRLPLETAVACAIAVCAGLHYAHDKLDSDGSPLEIVHRDVSPSNVFVTYDGGVKLIDFGIAKATTLPSETQLGTLKGKPGYMSPEQCRCEPLDRRSDVFSIGILLYELTTGRRAFCGDNEYLLAKQILEEHPTAPTAIDPDYPPDLEAIVTAALAKHRRDRPATALVLQDRLAAFAADRRLDLSQLALARVMAGLFADELEAWRRAQRAGQSLVEHVIQRTTSSHAIVAERVTRAEAPIAAEPGVRKRRWVAVAAAVAIAGGVALRVAVSDPPAAVAPPAAPVPEPAPAPAILPPPPADMPRAPVPASPPPLPARPPVRPRPVKPLHHATPAPAPAVPANPDSLL